MRICQSGLWGHRAYLDYIVGRMQPPSNGHRSSVENKRRSSVATSRSSRRLAARSTCSSSSEICSLSSRKWQLRKSSRSSSSAATGCRTSLMTTLVRDPALCSVACVGPLVIIVLASSLGCERCSFWRCRRRPQSRVPGQAAELRRVPHPFAAASAQGPLHRDRCR